MRSILICESAVRNAPEKFGISFVKDGTDVCTHMDGLLFPLMGFCELPKKCL